MPIFKTSFPPEAEYNFITIKQIVDVLPDTIPYEMDIYLGGKLACYGVGSGNIFFRLKQFSIPTVEQKMYFKDIVASLGVDGVLSDFWGNENFLPIPLYKKGILRREILNLLINETIEINKLTATVLMETLPKEIPFTQTIWVTGGIAHYGWSANDVDFMILEKQEDKTIYNIARDYFANILHWKCHIGSTFMNDREPIYNVPIYFEGKLIEDESLRERLVQEQQAIWQPQI